MTREEIKCRLALAQAVAHDPQTVFYIEPISSVGDENGERLSNLLAHVVAQPSRSLLVVTGEEFIFGFLDHHDGMPDDLIRARMQGECVGRPRMHGLN